MRDELIPYLRVAAGDADDTVDRIRVELFRYGLGCWPYRKGDFRWTSGRMAERVVITSRGLCGVFSAHEYHPGFFRLRTDMWIPDEDRKRIARIGAKLSVPRFELTCMRDEARSLVPFVESMVSGAPCRPPFDLDRQWSWPGSYAWSSGASSAYKELLAACGGNWSRRSAWKVLSALEKR